MAIVTALTSSDSVMFARGTASNQVAPEENPASHSMENGSTGEGAMEPADTPSDSDSDLEDESAPRPHHVTEKRRIQNAIFSNW